MYLIVTWVNNGGFERLFRLLLHLPFINILLLIIAMIYFLYCSDYYLFIYFQNHVADSAGDLLFILIHFGAPNLLNILFIIVEETQVAKENSAPTSAGGVATALEQVSLFNSQSGPL